MSVDFKVYRRKAFIAIRQLLCCQSDDVVKRYINKAKATTTEAELSRVLREVRDIL